MRAAKRCFPVHVVERALHYKIASGNKQYAHTMVLHYMYVRDEKDTDCLLYTSDAADE